MYTQKCACYSKQYKFGKYIILYVNVHVLYMYMYVHVLCMHVDVLYMDVHGIKQKET